jgi:hypothetical protein
MALRFLNTNDDNIMIKSTWDMFLSKQGRYSYRNKGHVLIKTREINRTTMGPNAA